MDSESRRGSWLNRRGAADYKKKKKVEIRFVGGAWGKRCRWARALTRFSEMPSNISSPLARTLSPFPHPDVNKHPH